MFRNSNPYFNRFVNAKKGIKVHPNRDASEWDLNNDSVKAMLQPGEIVIPVKYVNMVEPILEKMKIFNGNNFK